MAEAPLDWADIWPFMQATENIEEPWEAEALFEMSRGYLSAKVDGEHALAIPPTEQDDLDG